MKTKRLSIGILLIVAAAFLLSGPAMGKEGWKQEQDKMFTEMGIKPGDVFDANSIDKLKDFLPEGVVKGVKRGEDIIKIGELKYDFAPNASWYDDSAKNEGKYSLDEKKEVIDKGTNQYPIVVKGDLFPKIDLKNDPDAGIKYIHNVVAARGRLGSLHSIPTTEWVGTGGLERMAMSEYIDYYFWNRPDGEVPNPQKLFNSQLYKFIKPYDIQGMASLTTRTIDPKPDSVFAYVPSIRRVKKLSGANRSDPYAGSDFIIDDSFGWAGKNATMKWTVVKEMTVLVQLAPWHVDKSIVAKKQANGMFKSAAERFYSAYEKPGSKLAAWSKIDAVWVPRKVVVIQAQALDSYYSYGKCIYHVDPYMGFVHKAIYDRAGEYWKTMVISPACYDFVDGDKMVQRATTGSVVGYVVVDEKTHHASVCCTSGEVDGQSLDAVFLDPSIKQGMFESSFLNTWSR